ncbi:CTP synthase [Romeria aff. gracilis LEGE 07310]|uniref:CTP synthase (glutamine hydrolyzing) n=1 Tax=Vasconcelosia minhoensis LEGE 07310 TaxID=915328 RepID=A0A8J7DDL9_9CYAN|nr:CTP synthase [Romeria gracilis]MBE9080017.1 CTP synthase [Romeria aff. gracilis LEGE 07310]
MAIKVAILADALPNFPPQVTIEPALQHAASVLGVSVETAWFSSESLLSSETVEKLQQFDGIWGGPGDVQAIEGTLQGIRVAREQGIPFLGTCGGFQYAVLEFARHVLGYADANSAEFDPTAPRLVLTPLECVIAGKKMMVHIQSGTMARQLYGTETAVEEYYCNFGINPIYRNSIESAGLKITGLDQDGEPRIFELQTAAHPFYIASLFVPQTASTAERPHLLIRGFVAACQRGH